MESNVLPEMPMQAGVVRRNMDYLKNRVSDLEFKRQYLEERIKELQAKCTHGDVDFSDSVKRCKHCDLKDPPTPSPCLEDPSTSVGDKLL